MPDTAFASSDDVADRWRPLSEDEQALVNVLIDDASTLLRARFPGIDDQIGSTLDEGTVTIVVSNMVRRALIAPLDGVSQETQTTGPYSHSTSFANPMRNVFLTAADEMLILGYRPAAVSGSFSNTTRTCY